MPSLKRFSRSNGLCFRHLYGCVFLLAGALVGCTSVQPERIETYQCEAGREFSVLLASHNGVRVDIAGMSFPLEPDPVAGAGETHRCSVLTLWRDGKTARMTMDEVEEFRNCRRVP